MRFYQIIILLFIFVISGISCRKDFEYAASNGKLEFSKDTVFLDTIFSNIGSSTYALKVYNRSKEDISIPEIRLARGDNSGYRLNVDGVAGKSFTDVPLMAKDSLFIFIETTIDVSGSEMNEFLYTDELQFDRGDNLQEIPLVTLVRDVVFLFPSKTAGSTPEMISLGLNANAEEIFVEGFELEADELAFTDEIPYVIYGYAVVSENKVLTIAAGARIHFHENSGILVQSRGKIQINGQLSTDSLALEKEVIFEGDRLEPELGNVSGQWGGIRIASGSIENSIEHLTLKNATIGLRVEGDGNLQDPTLRIINSQIYNSAIYNLWGISAAIEAENMVLGNAGSGSLYCNFGGDYSFVHATIANYWVDSFRTGAALAIDTKKNNSSNNEDSADLIKADFINCIIDGNGSIELSLDETSSNTFDYFFGNCLIKFAGDTSTMNPPYDFDNLDSYRKNLFIEEAVFENSSKNNFRLSPT